jgi:hypothetical protein
MTNATPQRGDKLVWARGLERRPLAVRDARYVTVASWGLPDAPLAVTLVEVAGAFPMGLFDRVDPVEAEMDAEVERILAMSPEEAMEGVSEQDIAHMRALTKRTVEAAAIARTQSLPNTHADGGRE